MSYRVNPRELEAVSRLAGPQRYEYFLNKVVDFEELWSVRTDDGWAMLGDDEGHQCFPVWPAEAFAVQYCAASAPDLQPASISLSDWMMKWLPGLEGDERRVAVFPTTGNQGVVVEPAAMSRDLQASLGDVEDRDE